MSLRSHHLFGLCNAPATFQRLMDLVLAWSECLIYFGDIIVLSQDFTKHLQNLEVVFQRFQHTDLTLKPTKCFLFLLRVNFLGHIVSRYGVNADPIMIEKV